jgi:superfamily II DNA or RNA helicase
MTNSSYADLPDLQEKIASRKENEAEFFHKITQYFRQVLSIEHESIPEEVDYFLKEILPQVSFRKSLNLKPELLITEEGSQLLLHSQIKADDYGTHIVGSYRINFTKGDKFHTSQIVDVNIINTKLVSQQQLGMVPKLAMFNYKIEADMNIENILSIGKDDIEQLRGTLRGMFRADPLVHPHIKNIFDEEGGKSQLSLLQRTVTDQLWGMEAEHFNNKEVQGPLVSGIFMPVGTGKTFTVAEYIRETNNIVKKVSQSKDQIQNPGLIKDKVQIIYVVQNKRILQDASAEFKRTYNLEDEEILKIFGEHSRKFKESQLKKAKAIFITRTGLFTRIQEFKNYVKSPHDKSLFFIIDEAHHAGKMDGEFAEILDSEDSLGLRKNLNPSDRIYYMSATLEHEDQNIIKDTLKGNIAAPLLSEEELKTLREGQTINDISRSQLTRGMKNGYISVLNNYFSTKTLGKHGVDIENILNDINIAKGVFDERTLTIHRPLIEYMVKLILGERVEDTADRGIIFVPTVKHANYYKEIFNTFKIGVADVYHSEISETNKRTIYQWFTNPTSRTKHQYLFVIDSLNEGVDIPGINLIINARNTASFKLLMQNLGRAARVAIFKSMFRLLDLSRSFTHLVAEFVSKDDLRFYEDVYGRKDEPKSSGKKRRIIIDEDELTPKDFVKKEEEFFSVMNQHDKQYSMVKAKTLEDMILDAQESGEETSKYYRADLSFKEKDIGHLNFLIGLESKFRFNFSANAFFKNYGHLIPQVIDYIKQEIKIVEKKYRIGNPKLINVFTKQSIFLLRDILNYSLRYQKHALQKGAYIKFNVHDLDISFLKELGDEYRLSYFEEDSGYNNASQMLNQMIFLDDAKMKGREVVNPHIENDEFIPHFFEVKKYLYNHENLFALSVSAPEVLNEYIFQTLKNFTTSQDEKFITSTMSFLGEIFNVQEKEFDTGEKGKNKRITALIINRINLESLISHNFQNVSEENLKQVLSRLSKILILKMNSENEHLVLKFFNDYNVPVEEIIELANIYVPQKAIQLPLMRQYIFNHIDNELGAFHMLEAPYKDVSDISFSSKFGKAYLSHLSPLEIQILEAKINKPRNYRLFQEWHVMSFYENYKGVPASLQFLLLESVFQQYSTIHAYADSVGLIKWNENNLTPSYPVSSYGNGEPLLDLHKQRRNLVIERINENQLKNVGGILDALFKVPNLNGEFHKTILDFLNINELRKSEEFSSMTKEDFTTTFNLVEMNNKVERMKDYRNLYYLTKPHINAKALRSNIHAALIKSDSIVPTVYLNFLLEISLAYLHKPAVKYQTPIVPARSHTQQKNINKIIDIVLEAESIDEDDMKQLIYVFQEFQRVNDQNLKLAHKSILSDKQQIFMKRMDDFLNALCLIKAKGGI